MWFWAEGGGYGFPKQSHGAGRGGTISTRVAKSRLLGAWS